MQESLSGHINVSAKSLRRKADDELVTTLAAATIHQRNTAGKTKPSRSRKHHADVTYLYLSEIGRTRLLTAEEEISLARAAQQGCVASRQRMIESNLRLVG